MLGYRSQGALRGVKAQPKICACVNKTKGGSFSKPITIGDEAVSGFPSLYLPIHLALDFWFHYEGLKSTPKQLHISSQGLNIGQIE